MRPRTTTGLGLALAWFAFPMLPTLLGMAYHERLNAIISASADPREWGWLAWVVLTGPLLGYGFLAGATLELTDPEGFRGPKGWLTRRSIWVAVGPWAGILVAVVVFLATALVGWAYPPSLKWTPPVLPDTWWARWIGWFAFWFLLIGPIAYGWLVLAWASLRRARRMDQLRRSFLKGLAVAIGFVGSLFGSFWAITEGWRAYFFDPRIAPIVLATTSLVVMAGCSTLTVGEVRRRELFQSMLMAWLLGLALAWRWWSRSKPGSK